MSSGETTTADAIVAGHAVGGVGGTVLGALVGGLVGLALDHPGWGLLGGAVVGGVGGYVAGGAVASKLAADASGKLQSAKGAAPLLFRAGHTYLVTVTLAGPVSGSSTQGSVQSSVPSSLTVSSVGATPTSIEVEIAATADTTLSVTAMQQAVAAPPGSLVNVVDQTSLPPGG